LTGSGGYKYEERKIFKSHGRDYTLIFSYAGAPDAAQIMFGKVKDTIREETAKAKKAKDVFTKDRARTVLEKTFKDANSKGVQTLMGVATNNQHFMLRTNGRKVALASTEYIGAGDSSALRYLCDFLLESFPSMGEANVLGAYLISVATRYVDGCGGGPDWAALSPDGTITDGTGGPWPNARERFLYCEQALGNRLRQLLYSGGAAA
jgi:hypothetical protein